MRIASMILTIQTVLDKVSIDKVPADEVPIDKVPIDEPLLGKGFMMALPVEKNVNLDNESS
jgi:hypothetical protein